MIAKRGEIKITILKTKLGMGAGQTANGTIIWVLN